MRELTSQIGLGGPVPFDRQLELFSQEEMVHQLQRENQKLGELGVTTSISDMLYAVARWGYQYDYLLNADGQLQLTGLNCLAALVHAQPELLNKPLSHFEELAGSVSRLGLTMEMLIAKDPDFRYPPEFLESPRRALLTSKEKSYFDAL